MKLLHLSDLHLGKRLNQFSLLEDQKYILNQILEIVEKEQPDCIMIAGDVYDKAIPSAEAVALFDDFLSKLAEQQLPVFIISGNHDSPERVAFGAQIMKYRQIYLSPVYDGTVQPITLKDEFGEVCFYMLPFIKPFTVRNIFKDKKINSYTEAASVAVEAMQVDTSVRNVLIAHQFITGAEQCDSEEIYVGGLENIDADVFSAFDYTALGHLHSPQNVGGNPRIRYCGTPLKYSFSEVHHHKSVTIVQLNEKNTLPEIRTIPLIPLIGMQEIKGRFDEIIQMEKSDNYTRVILTDEENIPEAVNRLRRRFPNIMILEYENQQKTTVADLKTIPNTEQQTPLELFSEFYSQMNENSLTAEQSEFVENIINQIWGYNL